MKLENLNAFLEAIEKLGRAYPMISRGLAGLIREKAYEIAPRRTGRLRKSIGVRRTRIGYEVVMGGIGGSLRELRRVRDEIPSDKG